MSKLIEQVRSDHVLHAISQLHLQRGDQFFAEVKNGPTQLVAKRRVNEDGLSSKQDN